MFLQIIIFYFLKEQIMHIFFIKPSFRAKSGVNFGFTLVEMAIVLLIIGLMAGGIMTGQNLIKQARLRAVISEQDSVKQAINAFKIKFNYLPGDFKDAYNYWGSKCADTSYECNGNGNGKIEAIGGNESKLEIYRFWQHLNLAGIYPGSFTGKGKASGTEIMEAYIGENIPASKMKLVGMSVIYNSKEHNYTSEIYTGNILIFGGVVPSDIAAKPMFSTQDAYTIDQKIDDGMPTSGIVLSIGAASVDQTTGCVDLKSEQHPYNLKSQEESPCGLAFTLD